MEGGMTPFAKRMKQFAEENKTEVKSFSPVQVGTPVMGEGRAPLLGDVKSRDPEVLAFEAEKKQVGHQMENNKAKVEQAAEALRAKVASGEMSPADAEHAMDLLVNKMVDNEYIGYGDLDMRNRATGFGDKAAEAYGMYGIGMDPAQLAREAKKQEATTGVMSAMGSEPPMGEGKEPLMGGE